MAAAYQKMGEALLNTGRPIVYSLCQYGNRRCGEVGREGRRQSLAHHRRHQRPLGVHGQHRLQPAATARDKYASPGHWNDPDMLEVGNGGMTDDEYQHPHEPVVACSRRRCSPATISAT